MGLANGVDAQAASSQEEKLKYYLYVKKKKKYSIGILGHKFKQTEVLELVVKYTCRSGAAPDWMAVLHTGTNQSFV